MHECEMSHVTLVSLDCFAIIDLFANRSLFALDWIVNGWLIRWERTSRDGKCERVECERGDAALRVDRVPGCSRFVALDIFE